MGRPAIPRSIARDVLLEAGHRCAIPTCRQPTLEIAHIAPWSRVKKHEFHNLIALCPTCHTRYDRGEIDRKSMKQYKANLSILNSRYGELERRVLCYFAEVPEATEIWLAPGLRIMLMYLIEDGLLVQADDIKALSFKERDCYRITGEGREFVRKWVRAQKIE